MPTVPKRHPLMMRQLAALLPQLERYRGQVCVFGWRNEGYPRLADMRDAMLQHAEMVGARYVSFVDDDDLVADDFVASIMGALDSGPDHVGFQVEYWQDGRFKYLCDHSLRHRRWIVASQRPELRAGIKVLRDFTHLDPIRTSIAVKGSFGSAFEREAEDRAWVEQVRPYLSLAGGATEAYIAKPLYRYLWAPAESAWLSRAAARCTGGVHVHEPLPEHPYLTWHPESVK